MTPGSKRAQRWLDEHPNAQPWVAFLARVFSAQSNQRLSLSAAAVAFWAVLAISPLLIAIAMIFSRLVDPEALTDAVDELRKNAPESFNSVLATQVQKASEVSATAATWSVVLSLITVLWAVSRGVYTLLRAVRYAYGLPPQSYFWARALGFLGAVITAFVLGALILTTAAITVLLSDIGGALETILYGVLVIGGTLLLGAVFMGVFRVATGRDGKGRLYWPGALVGAFGTLAVFVGFAIYLVFAGSYEAIYGALAGSVILSIVTYTATYVILLGAVGNNQLRPREAPPASPSAPASAGEGPPHSRARSD